MKKELEELRVLEGGEVKESLRSKVLTKLTKLMEGLPSKVKDAMNDFKYDISCNPWKVLRLSMSVGLTVAAVTFPAAAVEVVVAGLVNAVVKAAMDAADEQCAKGAMYIFVRTAVIQTGLALVGILINEGFDATAEKAAETLFDASDEAIRIISKSGGAASVTEMVLAEKLKTFKCSCGNLTENMECEPTGGPTNPLYRLKEGAKNMFKKSADEGDDEFSDARDGGGSGGR